MAKVKNPVQEAKECLKLRQPHREDKPLPSTNGPDLMFNTVNTGSWKEKEFCDVCVQFQTN